MSKQSIISLVIAVIFIGGILWFQFGRDRVVLPQGRESETETLIIKDGEVVGVVDGENSELSEDKTAKLEDTEIESFTTTKEIMITDGVKHSVPLDDILSGGPPKDGIPPIDNPKFLSTDEANKFLDDKEPGIAISINGVDRFYPFQILVWHEIVNDTLGGQRILVSYCPLCLTAIVFDPVVQGERVEFGTSGRLWNSNLVMYDRKTDSLWSQVLGEAIVGEMTGTRLKLLSSDLLRYGNWKSERPNGEVLSRDTGAVRFYGQDPYGDYYTSEGLYFPVNNRDGRLSEKAIVLGMIINGKAKAYLPAAVKKVGEVEDVFEEKTLLLRYEPKIDAVRIFEKQKNGELVRVNPVVGFWFSWASAYPDTELYK